MRELISVGPPPSKRAIWILCAAVLTAQLMAMPFSYVPLFFLVSTLVSLLYLPIWIVAVGLILLFQGMASVVATLAVRRFAGDALSFSGWHVARWSMLGLLGGIGLAGVVVACDRLIGYRPGTPEWESGAGYRQPVVAALALLALPVGVVLGTIRGARYHSML